GDTHDGPLIDCAQTRERSPRIRIGSATQLAHRVVAPLGGDCAARAPHGRNDAAIDRSLSLVSTRPANGPPSGTSRAPPSRPGGSTGTAGSSDCPRRPRDTRAGPGSAGRGRTVRTPWGSPSVVFRFA